MMARSRLGCGNLELVRLCSGRILNVLDLGQGTLWVLSRREEREPLIVGEVEIVTSNVGREIIAIPEVGRGVVDGGRCQGRESCRVRRRPERMIGERVIRDQEILRRNSGHVGCRAGRTAIVESRRKARRGVGRGSGAVAERREVVGLQICVVHFGSLDVAGALREQRDRRAVGPVLGILPLQVQSYR